MIRDIRQARFNSSMVRLGGYKIDGAKMLSIEFQFQYGAIGRTQRGGDVTLPMAFQFQYGAIGRNACVTYNDARSVFQFQYGAIGRSGWLFAFLR